MLKKEKSQINKSEEILTFPMEDKTVLWFSGINKYIVSQYPASEIIQQVWMKKADSEIIKYCCKHLEMDEEQAKSVVADFQNHLQSEFKKNEQAIKKTGIDLKAICSGKACYSKKYYKINQFVFFAEFETASAEYYIHPKFAHLEISTPEKYTHHFKVCYENGAYSLIVNETLVGTWGEKDSHFMSGKFSMELLQKIYNKEELDWMGVFHAAGISNGESCVIFLGDSGNGKSTLSAILMASGLDVLSDDFLPVESKTSLVYRFTAALSIKKQAIDMLLPQFPELQNAREYENPSLQKIYRFLPPVQNHLTGVPCKALVFVKFDKNTGFRLEKMPRVEAFSELVPDSWIAPAADNATRFLKWFKTLPCYRLTYSDNKKMVDTIKEMLEHK